MMRAWNLLHYPALAQQRRQRHRLRTSAAGGLLGLCLSGLGMYWLELELARIPSEQSVLQTHLDQAKQRAQVQRTQERQQQTWDRQLQPLRQVLLEQQAWAAWYQALQQEAQRGSWLLLRLQQEPGRLELQGLSPDMRSLVLARERLTAQLHGALSPSGAIPGSSPDTRAALQDLHLHSVAMAGVTPFAMGPIAHSAHTVEFVLQAAWPVSPLGEAPHHKPRQTPSTGERP